jgi:uncharacterized damage-inducible protein DinB
MYTKPLPGDYPPFYENYFIQLPDQPVPELLNQQPAALIQLVSGLSEEQAEKAYAPGKWNTKQVLGHMIDTERIMLFRALCISRGEKQSLPGFDENAYVDQGGFSKRLLPSLTQEYKIVRENSQVFFQHLHPEAWNQRGWANNSPMTVNALLTMIVAHERHHLNLLRERYLPVWV